MASQLTALETIEQMKKVCKKFNMPMSRRDLFEQILFRVAKEGMLIPQIVEDDDNETDVDSKIMLSWSDTFAPNWLSISARYYGELYIKFSSSPVSFEVETKTALWEDIVIQMLKIALLQIKV